MTHLLSLIQASVVRMIPIELEMFALATIVRTGPSYVPA